MLCISLVFPLYNEEDTLDELWRRLETELFPFIANRYSYEVIFVNDGSRDRTAEKVRKLYEEYSNTVKFVSFAKNYGHQIAVTAGQDIASGDAVIIMDADLQDPPVIAYELIQEWEKGYDIVYAKRRAYKAHPVKKFFAWSFYRILKNIANVDIPVDTGDFRLLSKRVNDEMKKYKEKSRYLRGMTSLMGYRAAFVEFDRAERFAGKSEYPFKKSLKLALDGITGYSTFPLQFISRFGFFLSIVGFLFGFFYIGYTLVTGTGVSGWASIFGLIIFFFGVTMLMMGVLGEYIGRIYTEVLDRPLYTVDYYLGGMSDDEDSTRQRR